MNIYQYNNSTGLVNANTAVIRSDVALWLTEAVKLPTLDTTEGSVAGSFVDAFTALIAGNIVNSVDILNSMNPYFSSNKFIDNFLGFIGVSRPGITASIVELTLVGEIGTPVPAGTEFLDTSGNIWISDYDVIISINKNIDVTATSINLGNIIAAAGTINIISTVTQIIGLNTVINVQDAIPGNAGLTNSEALSFYYEQIGNQGSGSRVSLQGNLGAVEKIGSYSYLINSESTEQTIKDIKLLPNSIWVCAANGLKEDIANAIQKSWTAGFATNGTTEVILTSPIYNVIFFDYAVKQPIKIKANIILGNSTVNLIDITNFILTSSTSFLKVGTILTSYQIANIILNEFSGISITSLLLTSSTNYENELTSPVNTIFTLEIGDILLTTGNE